MALEPQAQLIWQHVDFGTARDPFATVRFDPDEALTGRIGVRLFGDVALSGMTLKPYLLANVWRTFSGSDVTTFNVTPIATSSATRRSNSAAASPRNSRRASASMRRPATPPISAAIIAKASREMSSCGSRGDILSLHSNLVNAKPV